MKTENIFTNKYRVTQSIWYTNSIILYFVDGFMSLCELNFFTYAIYISIIYKNHRYLECDISILNSIISVGIIDIYMSASTMVNNA